MNDFLRRRRTTLRKIGLGLAITLGGPLSGSTAQARAGSSGALTLSWSAPDECPSQQQVESEIARLVGGDLALVDGSDLRADVTVVRGPLWSATLTTQHGGQSGERSIQAPSCQAAADAIALIIALAIDPDAVAVGPQSVAATPPVREDRQLWILAGVHAQGRSGTLPSPDVGVGLGLGLAGRRWWTELRWTYGLRQDQTASLPSGASGRFNVTLGSLTGCIDLVGARLALGPCAVAEGGRASATGYGATAGFSSDVLWLAVGGGGFSSLALSEHVRALVEVDVLAPLYRPDFVFEDIPGVIFKAPAVGGRALVEVSWQF